MKVNRWSKSGRGLRWGSPAENTYSSIMNTAQRWATALKTHKRPLSTWKNDVTSVSHWGNKLHWDTPAQPPGWRQRDDRYYHVPAREERLAHTPFAGRNLRGLSCSAHSSCLTQPFQSYTRNTGKQAHVHTMTCTCLFAATRSQAKGTKPMNVRLCKKNQKKTKVQTLINGWVDQ